MIPYPFQLKILSMKGELKNNLRVNGPPKSPVEIRLIQSESKLLSLYSKRTPFSSSHSSVRLIIK